jgi:ABC-2 type transport system permease protein
VRLLVEIYLQQFKTTTAMMFQYRASLLIWMIGQVLEPLIYLVVWSTVSNTLGGNVGNYTTAQFAGYFLVFMVVNQITYTWIMFEFEYRVREGMLSFALLRPVHPIHSFIADNLSSKLITLPIMMAIAIALAIVFSATMSLTWIGLAFFIPALLLAFLIRFLLEWTLALAAFWTTRVSALNRAYFTLMLFLSGEIAPLSLLPAPIQTAASISPFHWMLGFPVEILLGRLTVTESILGIGIQVIWLLAALLLVNVVWKAGIRVYSAVGT